MGAGQDKQTEKSPRKGTISETQYFAYSGIS